MRRSNRSARPPVHPVPQGALVHAEVAGDLGGRFPGLRGRGVVPGGLRSESLKRPCEALDRSIRRRWRSCWPPVSSRTGFAEVQRRCGLIEGLGATLGHLLCGRRTDVGNTPSVDGAENSKVAVSSISMANHAGEVLGIAPDQRGMINGIELPLGRAERGRTIGAHLFSSLLRKRDDVVRWSRISSARDTAEGVTLDTGGGS